MTATGDGRLAGRVGIVTGAGSRTEGIGNGRAAAVLMARQGAKVALVDADAAAAEHTRRTIEAEGGTAIVVEADVADGEACRGAVAATVDSWGRLDCLVNNVGITGPHGSAVDLDLDAWDRAMRVNVTSMMLMARHAIPAMRKAGAGGIVNISSVGGLLGVHPGLLYGTSKAAVIGLTRTMAMHHGAEGIRVNCICPGMVHTPMVYSRGMDDAARERRRQSSLLKTEGTGWDIGHAVVYLLSDEARWVTGVVFPVDAGLTAGWTATPVPPAP